MKVLQQRDGRYYYEGKPVKLLRSVGSPPQIQEFERENGERIKVVGSRDARIIRTARQTTTTAGPHQIRVAEKPSKVSKVHGRGTASAPYRIADNADAHTVDGTAKTLLPRLVDRQVIGTYTIGRRSTNASQWRLFVNGYEDEDGNVLPSRSLFKGTREECLAYMAQHSNGRAALKGEPTQAEPKAEEVPDPNPDPILDLLDPDRLHAETVAFDVVAFSTGKGERGYEVYRRFAGHRSERIDRQLISGPDWWFRRRCRKAKKHWQKLFERGHA